MSTVMGRTYRFEEERFRREVEPLFNTTKLHFVRLVVLNKGKALYEIDTKSCQQYCLHKIDLSAYISITQLDYRAHIANQSLFPTISSSVQIYTQFQDFTTRQDIQELQGNKSMMTLPQYIGSISVQQNEWLRYRCQNFKIGYLTRLLSFLCASCISYPSFIMM